MVWEHKGKLMKSPSTYKIAIEDLDNDSHTSKITGALMDNVVAVGMLKADMTFDYNTEEEAENLLAQTYVNPMICTMKTASVEGGLLENAKFRVSKRNIEMYNTSLDRDPSKSKWKVSFNLMQKELTEQQKQTVNKAKGLI